jgi:hypothetical protein
VKFYDLFIPSHFFNHRELQVVTLHKSTETKPADSRNDSSDNHLRSLKFQVYKIVRGGPDIRLFFIVLFWKDKGIT